MGEDHRLKKILGPHEYVSSVTSILKLVDPMQTLIENIELLMKDFTYRDHVTLIGVFNDLNYNRAPSFEMLVNKLKACMHTNILMILRKYPKNVDDEIWIFRY